MASSALCLARTLDLGRRGWLPSLPRRVSAHSGQPPLTRARQEEGRGEGGADNGPGPGSDGRRCAPVLGSGQGAAPARAFMLVVPPSLRADEVSLRGACGWGEGTGKGRMVADDRMWERDPPPARPEGVGIPLGLESTRVLPSFWVGIRNPTWAVSSLHAAWGSRVPT